VGGNLANPMDWADPAGAVVFYAVLFWIVFGCLMKLLGARWDDWLDEVRGRGSIRDPWER
jgi:hypothetical protein